MKLYCEKKAGRTTVSMDIKLPGGAYGTTLMGQGKTNEEAYGDLINQISNSVSDLLSVLNDLRDGKPEPEPTKISMDKTYKTMSGKEVKIYSVDGKVPYSVHGSVLEEDGWTSFVWTSQGKWYDGGGPLSLNDLVIESPSVCQREDQNYEDNEGFFQVNGKTIGGYSE